MFDCRAPLSKLSVFSIIHPDYVSAAPADREVERLKTSLLGVAAHRVDRDCGKGLPIKTTSHSYIKPQIEINFDRKIWLTISRFARIYLRLLAFCGGTTDASFV
jgi:hypothetical protein